ncbi:hypothetical protein DFH28DRAFT_922892 [Melampsora americana]|nr:hypothetical protein DFH28DRAFT_922892 [Melampsora americana]
MCQRTLINLWTCVQSGTFGNINHNIDQTEDNNISHESDQINSSNASDVDDKKPECLEKNIANIESLLAPFSSLEGSRCQASRIQKHSKPLPKTEETVLFQGFQDGWSPVTNLLCAESQTNTLATPDFNSSILPAINVKEFGKTFDAIGIRPGFMMKTYCGDLMYELSNQEYNCHFLATSNTVGALELDDPLIDELNASMRHARSARWSIPVLCNKLGYCHLQPHDGSKRLTFPKELI